MERQEVLNYLGGCFSGEPASCSYACPFRLDLRSFLKKMARGRFDAAYKELSSLIPFPEIACSFCSEPCRSACQCGTVLGGESICVGALERSCIHLAKHKEPTVYALPQKAEKIAVVGAGLAGLSCALMLARKKYQVTIFEKSDAPGGALRSDPRFAAFQEEIGLQFSADRPEFVFQTEIRSPDELKEYNAVFLATGAQGEDFGLKAGWDCELCHTARPGVFLGGALVGLSEVEGMAAAVRASRSIESYVQTGNPENAAEKWEKKNACRFAPHDGDAPSAAFPLDDGDAYLSESAKAEAGRCLQCDCKACLNVCELMQKYKKMPSRVASDVLQDGEARNSVSSAAITRETWSCNLCGRCAEKCSEGTDVGGMLQLSRVRRVEGKLYPPAIHSYWLREMDFAAGDGALVIPGSGKYVFFPGCRLGAVNPDYVLKSFDILRGSLGSGLVLNCCGIPAYWAGEQKKFEAHAAGLRGIWEALGRPVFVLACASCRKVFRRFLPEIETVSLYELLPPENTARRSDILSAAVFDPCAAAPFPEMRTAVRVLAETSGTQLTAFSSDGKCCGYGGHMQLANPELFRRITENRAGETEEPYITYCTNCRETLRSAGKPSVHILDLYFDLETGDPSLEEKRRNTLLLKQKLTETYGMGEFRVPEEAWDSVEITVSEKLQRKMDSILVPLGDVRKVIWNAEESGSGFVNGAGELLANLQFETITVWAKARKLENGSYDLLDVYSHRMRAGKGSV